MEKDELTQKTSNYPHENASLISKIFFCWALPFLYKRYKNEIVEEEIYTPLKCHKSGNLGYKLEEAWKSQVNQNPSLWWALWKTFKLEFLGFGLMFSFREFALKMSQPVLIGKLMSYYTNPDEAELTTKNEIYLHGSLILVVSFLDVLIGHNYMYGIQHLGMKIKISCCSLIYRKMLKMNKTSLAQNTTGKIINLISNDVNRFESAPMSIHQLVVAPIETIAVMYYLYVTSGPNASSGIIFLILFIPTQMYIGKLASRYRLKISTKTDERVHLMTEILSGIQVIKMYVWEKPFSQLIEKARRLEIEQVKVASYLKALNVSFMLFVNRTGIFLCIITYALYKDKVDAEYVFVVSCCYAILRQTLTVYIPFGINSFAETKISVERIRTFLLSDEVQDDTEIMEEITYTADKKGDGQLTENHSTPVSLLAHQKKPVGITLVDVSVTWDKFASKPTLNNINMEASSGGVVAVIGPVGSGKSTLLYTILKEVSCLNGRVEINGRISYAPQEPWLFSGTVRQNILFGCKFDKTRYEKVIEVCCLIQDVSNFADKDNTLVGEKGVFLSGGQKARINLARAVYKDADIYLLDDPISAVDPRVANQIFHNCILDFLKDKCIVLVTHQTQYLHFVKKTYSMNSGTMKLHEVSKEVPRKEETGSDVVDNLTGQECYKPSVATKNEIKEGTSSGTVSSYVYKMYLMAGGNILPLMFLLFILAQSAASGVDYFVGFWVNLNNNPEIFTTKICVYIYTGIIILLILTTVIRSITYFRFCMRASTNLHNKMFSKVIKAPMMFFNLNPSGRIINRFSKDIGLIDEVLPSVMMETFQIAFIVLGSAMVITSLNPWILFLNVVVMIMFYYFRIVFLTSSRHLKRTESTRRSPIFSHVTASVQGIATIRSFNGQNRLQEEFDRHQDCHTSAFYTFLACNRAFGYWVDMICVLYTIIVISSVILIDIQVGNVGLAVTQSINLIGVCQWGLRQWSEMENQMVSVERVVEYTKISPEIEEKYQEVPENWPRSGRIDFQSVYLKYATTEPYVLNNITFSIKSKEKIGIVGRTGSGKTSLISTLFNLFPYEGRILVDDIDIKTISLSESRSKISIIPQQPILFSGSVRENLDPFNEYNDEKLWRALEKVELKSVITNLPKDLSSEILETGSNFSVGQRQLICLARALLRSNSILVLDEATGSIDLESDRVIQKTIREEFKDCTVLTIAHRLNTVMDSDRVLIMDSGKIVEFDRPNLLLKNESSIFYRLVQDSGKPTAVNVLKGTEENN